ncbi:TatD family hydrolase [Methanobrevibacter filiformis]|uniref:Putative deoxyribonuclease YjjV n=1 Tax=Methanobrevibacter filiformis TaxID=55758 RepID=A0A166EBC2_9EURY|nr:TatD family hydrolase [Methanobrevibacter filiformis]KZX16471.1 putative deoxyribonuclease YjjV [Methanobrevibacter filiformis]
MIDSHIHGDSRSYENYQDMNISGIDKAITCAYYPYYIDDSSVLLNHFKRILYYETERAKKAGLYLHVALGLHPANILKSYEDILKEVENLAINKKIIAIGEIGLENNREIEIEIFKEQLHIADNTKTPVIIHTPRKNKLEILHSIKEIVLENIDPRLVVIDHINNSVVNEVIDEEFTLGLTVQPEKMETIEAVDILRKYGFNKFMLNSDVSYMPSDILSVPKTVQKLRMNNFKQKDIEKVSKENAKKFFNIK